MWNTFLWLYRSVGFEENITYTKKGIKSARYCLDVADFTFAMWQIIFCLLCKFISSEVLLIHLFEHMRIFLEGLGNSSEFLGSSKWVKRFEGNLSICWGKQERARTCRGKILRVLKLTAIFLMHFMVLVFIGVRSFKPTIYCATKLVFPSYIFSFNLYFALLGVGQYG